MEPSSFPTVLSVSTEGDPDIIKQGDDVTVMAPTAEVKVIFGPKE